jgi:hypothetical protein
MVQQDPEESGDSGHPQFSQDADQPSKKDSPAKTDVVSPSQDEPSGFQEEANNRVGWVSQLVACLWWPESALALERLAWQMLPDLLRDSKPAWMRTIKLTKFKLGKQPPVFSNIHVIKNTNKVSDEEIIIEADVVWQSEQDIELLIKPLPKQLTMIPDVLTKLVSNAVSFTCGVEKFKMKGRIRFAFDPLLRRLPIIGAVKVSLVTLPEYLDFTTTVMGGQKLEAILPSLKAWLMGFINDTLLSSYVLPEHWLYQIDQKVKDIEVPEGMLQVTVVEATDVPKGDYIQLSSPYVRLFVRKSRSRRTSTQEKTRHPVWKDFFQVPVDLIDQQRLVCVLYDYDVLGGDDELGRVTLPIRDFPLDQEKDLWLELEHPKEAIKSQQAKEQFSERAQSIFSRVKHKIQEKEKPCSLHIKVKLKRFNDDEIKAIGEAQQKDDFSVLDKAPHLAELAQQGVLVITVHRVSNLVPQPWIKGRHKLTQIKVRCGNVEKTIESHQGSRTATKIESTTQVDISTSNCEKQHGDQRFCIVEVWDTKWRNQKEGEVHFDVEQIKRQITTRGTFRLHGGQSPSAKISLQLKWESHLGSNEQWVTSDPNTDQAAEKDSPEADEQDASVTQNTDGGSTADSNQDTSDEER